MVNYNIDEYSAELLLRLIENRQDIKKLYQKMQEDPDFGSEDYIIDSKNYYNKLIDNYNQVLYDFKKSYNIKDNSLKIKKKTK